MRWDKVLVGKKINSYDEDIEITTFHKNPINIASKALFFLRKDLSTPSVEKAVYHALKDRAIIAVLR